MHNAVSKGLKPDVKSKIAGVALFGDTRNQQDKGHIPNFPTEKSKVWCNASDGVCGGMLNVNIGHLSYSGSQISEAARYLAGLAKSHTGGSSGGETTPAPAPKVPKAAPKPASPPKSTPPKAAPPKATSAAPAAATTPAATPAEPAADAAAE
jgi:hypothetical protein